MKKQLLFILCSLSFINIANAGEKEFHHPQEFVENLKKDKKPGKAIYKAFCANCHNVKPLISVGAPRFRIKKDWADRIKNTKDNFLEVIDKGKGLMPARGGCFECSDQDLLEAIKYMLPKQSNM